MKTFLTLKESWENADELKKNKTRKNNIIGEGYVTLIYVSDYHNCCVIKYIVSLKDSEIPMH